MCADQNDRIVLKICKKLIPHNTLVWKWAEINICRDEGAVDLIQNSILSLISFFLEW